MGARRCAQDSETGGRIVGNCGRNHGSPRTVRTVYGGRFCDLVVFTSVESTRFNRSRGILRPIGPLLGEAVSDRLLATTKPQISTQL